MKKVLALLVLALITKTATADLGTPFPQRVRKVVTVNNQVVLGTGVTGYVFVEQVVRFIPGSRSPVFRRVTLNANQATPINKGDPRVFVSLHAVPQDVAKKFSSDLALFLAIEKNRLRVPTINFFSTVFVSGSVKNASVDWTYTITGISAKGIQTRITGEGVPPSPNRRGPPDVEDAPTDTATATPRGGVWVAGLAATLGVMLGGFWLAGRARRKL